MSDSRPSVHQRAAGRWEGILSSFGVEAPLLNRRKHHPCPWCGGKDRFRFTDKDGSGSFLCGQCGKKSPIDLLMKFKGWDFSTAAREIEQVMGNVKPVVRRDNSDWALKQKKAIWQTSRPIEPNDVVDRYLSARGITMKRFPVALRTVPRMEHLSEEKVKTYHPGMIAVVRSAEGEPVNIHRTYLTDSGQKAAVDEARKLMVGTIPPGSAVQLYANVGDVLGIAEGIETALAASAIFRVPVWSALNSKILENWLAPPTVKQVIVFGDNDPKFGGQAAALALAHRLSVRSAGPLVRVEIPEMPGEDWNDVLLRRGSQA